MRNFFDNLRYRMQESMQGRYGRDEFSRFLTYAALVFIILSFFRNLWAPFHYFYWIGVIALVYSIFRCYSKKLDKREAELEKYLGLKKKVKSIFGLQKRKWDERKTHVFFTCPKCHATVRVPRGKGNIQITCPKCKEQFIKRT